jgi:ribonuclease-3
VNDPVYQLEQILGYTFADKTKLNTALTHRSLGQDNNERLEYLGDALLGFIIAEAIYRLYPGASEGELTRLRATLVKGETLAKLARKLNLGSYIKLGASELKSGGWRRSSILANAIEALIGAIYLDGGMDICRERVLQLYGDILKTSTPETLIKDPKTRLQEHLQSLQMNLPEYKVVMERGEAHDRIFTVRCEIPAMTISVQAEGKSKRNAEQAAAQLALDTLNI